MKPSDCGVIFDVDGVLADSFAAHRKSWQLLAESMGRKVTDDEFARTFGRTSRDIIAILFREEEPETIRRLDDHKESIYRDLVRGHLPEMPGATALVRTLHAAGFRLAIGSSGPPENVNLVCAELQLDACLSAKVTGQDVSRGKPDPQVFQLAAKRLGLSPTRCVVVEDAPSGVEAARRAGMRCIALAGSHDEQALGSADRVVRALHEIDAGLILSLLEGDKTSK